MWKKRRVREDGASFMDKINGALELPVDIMEGLPEIEFLGNREAVVEHCQGVLEYNETVIRLNTGKLILKFSGRNLRLKRMTADSVVVEGYFTGVEFLR